MVLGFSRPRPRAACRFYFVTTGFWAFQATRKALAQARQAQNQTDIPKTMCDFGLFMRRAERWRSFEKPKTKLKYPKPELILGFSSDTQSAGVAAKSPKPL